MGVDGTLQMSFQLAHYRMYGHSASTYESASTAGFKHGRTETIRSATVESDAFCRAFSDPDASVASMKAALDRAVAKHGALTKEALTGKGWDRHLFALQKIAQERGIDEPLFSDPVSLAVRRICVALAEVLTTIIRSRSRR
jgi:carnitine O-palmitoyltransferase 2